MRLAAAADRWTLYLDGAKAQSAARLLPLLYGLVALAYGQDANWDLGNYHWYAPFALLNGKIGYDLAPGQWQGYFNPTLDLLYYGLNQLLPAPAAGFAMGALHGVNALLLLAIARVLLPAGQPRARAAALLLALAGCLQPAFMAGVGNTMGDNMTTLTVLGALLLLLRGWPGLLAGGRRGAATAVLAGLLAGLGTGLKLTNAVYALALCLAMLGLAMPFRLRVRTAFVFGAGVLAGIGIAAGHWYWRMWSVFGNPLFPQFNDLFRAPLAAPIGIGDTGWIPKGLAEKLLWPFIFTLQPKRTIEIFIVPLVWPMLYLAFGWLALALLRRATALVPLAPAPPLAPRVRYTLLFMALAYLVWLNLFGIYRYLTPLEVLAPLALWLIVQHLSAHWAAAPRARAARLAAGALLLAAVAGQVHGGWGHARWTLAGIDATVPAFAAPRQNLVLTVHGNPPMGWLVPFFPPELAFVALGGGFPESPAYVARMEAMMAARSGPFYVMMTAAAPQRTARAAAAAAERDTAVLADARQLLARYRLRYEPSSCTVYPAALGRNRHAYRLCRVERLAQQEENQ